MARTSKPIEKVNVDYHHDDESENALEEERNSKLSNLKNKKIVLKNKMKIP